MKLKIFKWTLFLFYKITKVNVNQFSGEYLFDVCIQKHYNGNNYLTGVLTRNYGN